MIVGTSAFFHNYFVRAMHKSAMYFALGALSFILYLLIISQCQAQTTPAVALQASTLNAILANCTYESDLDAAFAACPATTCHVVVQRQVQWPTAELGQLWNVNLSIGCCPEQTYGIYDATDNLLYGCCAPSDTPSQIPVPCFNNRRQMIGCTNYASRCCGDQICGRNYVCCGDQCCPKMGTGQYSLADSCLVVQEENPGTNTQLPTYKGCKYSPLQICEPTQTYTVNCNPYTVLDNSTTCPFCAYPSINCIFPPPNVEALQLPCKFLIDCVKTDLVIQNCSGVVVGCIDNVSTVDIPVGCTDTSLVPQDVCIYPPVGSAPILVGDRGADETCCGPFICSKGMKCCNTTFLAKNIFNQEVNQTQFYGCCLDAPGVECCYNNIMTLSDERQAANFFCGMAFDTVPCQVDKMRPPLYFALARLALNFAPAT